MTRGVRLGLVGVCLLLLLFAGPSLGAVAGTSPGVRPTEASGPAQTGPVTPDGANATPIRHEDPSRLDESGDLTSLQRWLAADLASRLSRSTLEIGRGEYERARGITSSLVDSSNGLLFLPGSRAVGSVIGKNVHRLSKEAIREPGVSAPQTSGG